MVVTSLQDHLVFKMFIASSSIISHLEIYFKGTRTPKKMSPQLVLFIVAYYLKTSKCLTVGGGLVKGWHSPEVEIYHTSSKML